ncbi:metalloregulator ArsR/SmtB family transcription factor [Ruficoccus amylovorans]|uniref:Metalloregulator ArsR/SmtB family transcription factor n=1 Tax=Ruficoccus amylovorans TaxID=1804625 RepID=A0A842HJ48_9BACT|nr:metalloregulator ArsR/SmtB family transcription factor [Ruficoccus amylovorans]MBC2595201.1 metalloregulator ArsR/SmtB family transcription factor [Ruficoccus amylovorans]
MTIPLQEKQQQLYRQLARIGEALASPQRLKLLSLLSQGEKHVDQLAELTGQSKAAASAHLKVLRGSRLADTRKDGRNVYYRLAGENVSRFWLTLRTLGEDLDPEMREILHAHFETPESLSALSMSDVLQQVQSRKSLLLDLRPEDEFAAGHLPHARNLPFPRLEAHLGDIPAKRPVLVYCRGPYCLMAIKGTSLLRDSGVPAHRLRFSVPEWRAADLPLDDSQ